MSEEDPFAQIERVFDQLAAAGGGHGGIDVDVVEHEDVLEVTADLPGYEREEIDVRLQDGQLEIVAERASERAEYAGRVHRRERRTEAVSRSLTLPAVVDAEGTEATYDRGVLTVRLPKASREGDGTTIPVS